MGVKPTDQSIRNVVAYLQSIGLAVYGDYRELDESGVKALGGLMDYDVEKVIKYRKMAEKVKRHERSKDTERRQRRAPGSRA